jgi:LacI family transcriptional regulator
MLAAVAKPESASKNRAAPARTLESLAAKGGMSAATLSRVLNHPQQVRAPLRERAEKLLRDAGYVAHGAARSLASKRTRTMGAVVPTIDSALFAKIVEGLQQALQPHGYQLLLASSNYNPQREAAEVRALLERGVDGLMLIGRERAKETYAMLRARSVPFVTTCHYEAEAGWPTIGWDNVREATRIADYLLDIGHRRFGVIAGLVADNDRAADRVAGFRAALARRGVRLPANAVLERPYNVAQARQAMAALLRLPERPSAVLCGNDILAYGALQECLWQDLRVPHDISIAGFDNIEMAAHCRPGITTLDVPATEIGEIAGHTLLAAQTAARDDPPAHVFLELELIVRDSTAPPQTAAKRVAAKARRGTRTARPLAALP